MPFFLPYYAMLKAVYFVMCCLYLLCAEAFIFSTIARSLWSWVKKKHIHNHFGLGLFCCYRVFWIRWIYNVLWLLLLALTQCRKKILYVNWIQLFEWTTQQHVPLTLTLCLFTETSKRINVVITDPTHVTIT